MRLKFSLLFGTFDADLNSPLLKAWGDYEDYVGEDPICDPLCNLIVEAMAHAIYYSPDYILEKTDDK